MNLIDVSDRAEAISHITHGARAGFVLGIFFLYYGIPEAMESGIVLSKVFDIFDPWADPTYIETGHLLVFSGIVCLLISYGISRRNVVAMVFGAPFLVGSFIAYILDQLLAAGLISTVLHFWPLSIVGYYLIQGVVAIYKYGQGTIQETNEVKEEVRAYYGRLASNIGRSGNIPHAMALAYRLLAITLYTVGALLFFKDPVCEQLGQTWHRGLAVDFAALFVAIIIVSFGVSSYRRSKRYTAVEIGELRKFDARRPVILLRSFSDDMVPLPYDIRLFSFNPNLYSRRTFEEVIAEQLWDYGPVIAAGRPEESLPPLGAVREYITHEDWRERIEEYVKDARLIAVIIGTTKALLWELGKVADMHLLHKVVFLAPPIETDDLEKRWTSFQEDTKSIVGFENLRSISITSVLVMGLDKTGNVGVVSGNSRKESFYAEALSEITKIHDQAQYS